MKRPGPLKKGDTIGVISPAGPVDPEALSHGVREIERMGFQVVLGKNVLRTHRYLAGRDEERLDDLHEMFLNPGVSAIMCARGGYGTVRLLPSIKQAVLADHPKIFIGSSDVTALLLFLVQELDWVAFHGPMVVPDFGRSPSPISSEAIRMLLQPDDFIKPIRHSEVHCLQEGVSEGRLVGGCMSLVCSMLGTSFDPQTQGSILFLEDVNEPPYRIDRMLTQLKLAGKLEGVRGLLFGRMVNCEPGPQEGYSIDDLLLDRLGDFKGPILRGWPAGHGIGQILMPLGVTVRIHGKEKTLVCLESPLDEKGEG